MMNQSKTMQWVKVEKNSNQLVNRLVSVSLPASDISPLAFLHSAQGHERFYWADSDNGATFAGIGIAANLSTWGKERFQNIQQQVKDLFDNFQASEEIYPLAAPRLFGGFSFRPDFTPDKTWSIFQPAQFILPHYQLVVDDKETWLTINALIALDEDVEECRQGLQTALQEWLSLWQESQPSLPVSFPLPTVTQLNYPTPYPKWEQMICHATQQMTETHLQKVVLSHVCEIRFQDNVDILPILTYLNQTYDDCYRFLFEPRPYHAFFGATPELLVHLTGQTIHTIALAGSAPRGTTQDEDQQLANDLMQSAKNRMEHQLVVDAIRERLTPITSRLTMSAQPRIHTLHNIHHLHTGIYGRLQEPSGVLPVVELLHPTPALGGTPRQLALDTIRQLEPVPRGWYAAPIGMIDHHLDGTFGVAIRSAVSQYKRVWLHAGAGIVPASEPQTEWDETMIKFKPMLHALGIRELPPSI